MTAHFSKEELACTCGCGKANATDKLLGMLEAARSIYGLPMKILSGTRCLSHNEAVGGTTSSAHLTGEAVDIYCGTSLNRFKLVKALLSAGFNRIGIGFKGLFVHADVSSTLPQDMMWGY